MAKNLFRSTRNIPKETIEMENMEEIDTDIQEIKSANTTPESQYHSRREVKKGASLIQCAFTDSYGLIYLMSSIIHGFLHVHVSDTKTTVLINDLLGFSERDLHIQK